MMRTLTRKISCLLIAFAVAATVWGCTGGQQLAPESSEAEQGATMARPVDGEGISAFSGAEDAQAQADEWQADARLYAVAAATPNLDAQGRSPSWLYTYVSESAGSVMSVTVSSEGAEGAPGQELPGPDVDFILENTLPEVSGMLDSPEAMERSEDVRPVLEGEPGSEASAGLDSFSGGEAQWIFATTQGEDRVEERVPAVAGE